MSMHNQLEKVVHQFRSQPECKEPVRIHGVPKKDYAFTSNRL